MDQVIDIKRPYITQKGLLYRLNVDVYEEDTLYKLFAEVEEEYARFLCHERLDAFVYLTLPVALRKGYDIHCEAPVTEQFLHNINEILIPHLVRGDTRLHPITVSAPTIRTQTGGAGVGTAASCGVDSMYTIMEYTNGKYQDMQLTHLVITSSSADLMEGDEDDLSGWENKYEKSFDRYREASELFKLPLVKIYSNFLTYLNKLHDYRHIYVHHYITMADILVLKKLWRVYYFSSAMDFTNFNLTDNSVRDTDKHELLSMHVLSTSDFSCFSGGAKAGRIEKTLALTEYPPARRLLHPCFNHGQKNCSKPSCIKCLRALLTFDYYDKLDDMSEVFYVEEYRNNRPQYLYKLAAFRENEFFKELYAMFLEKYPEDMNQALQSYEKDIAPVSRTEFNTLKDAYSVALTLCSLDDPKGRLIGYFKSQGILSLYCPGNSRLGTKIVSLIREEIKCFRMEDSDLLNCDASLILYTGQKQIKATAAKLRKMGVKKIFDIYDIEDEFRRRKR